MKNRTWKKIGLATAVSIMGVASASTINIDHKEKTKNIGLMNYSTIEKHSSNKTINKQELMEGNKKFNKYSSAKKIPDLSNGFMKEINDVIYFGSKNKGLLKLTEKGVTHISTVDVSTGFIEQIDGVVYVGTKDKGIMKLVKGKLENVSAVDVSGGFIKKIDGVVYVGTKTQGLMKLVNGKLIPISLIDVSSGFIKKIDGVVYVGTKTQGLMKLVNGKLAVINSIDMSNGFIQVIDGVVYVGTKSKGLMKLVNGKLENISPINVSGGFIKKIDGVIYVGTKVKGLMTLNHNHLKSLSAANLTVKFLQKINGMLYVGTETKGLLQIFNDKLEIVSNTAVLQGFIKKIDGVVYVGTLSKGLMKLVNGKLENISPILVWGGFIKKIDGVVYVGTSNKGIKKLVNGKLEDFISASLRGAFIEKIDGVFYIGSYKYGLQKLINGNREEFININLKSGFIKKIDGVVYVGTRYKGLMKLVKGKLEDVSAVDVSGGFIKKIDGVVYVGTKAKGLMKLVKGKLTTVSPIDVSDGFIKKIDGVVYVGTTHAGLFKLENGHVKNINIIEVWHGFIEKVNGVIYLGTNSQGLMKMPGLRIMPADTSDIFWLSWSDSVNKEFQKGIIIHQGTKKVSEIAKTIHNVYDLRDKFGIILPKLKNIEIREIDASGTDQVISVRMTVFNSLTHRWKRFITSILGKSDTAIDKMKDIKLIKELTGGLIINQGTQKASVIAKTIHNIKDLKDKLGITFPTLSTNTKITKIVAIGNAKGEITVTITTNTPNEQYSDKDITIAQKIQGKSDANIKNKKHFIQVKTNKLVQDALNKGNKVIGQETKTVSEIAKTIHNAKDLEDKFGVTLPALKDSTISSISAKGYPSGLIIVSVTISANDTTDIIIQFKKFYGKNDKDIKQQIKNNKLVHDILNKNYKIINQGLKTTSEIAKTIHNIKDLEDKFGVTLPTIKGAVVSNIKTVANKNGLITISLFFKSLNSSSMNLSKKFTITVKGKPDVDITQEKNGKLVQDILDKGGKVINQGKKTASEIAKTIHNAQDLEDKLGIILPKLVGSTISSISATSYSNKLIIISVVILTKNATNQKLILAGVVNR